jgi:hypothetical protein
MKDPRYNTVKKLVKANEITTFTGIFEIVPKTRVALDLKLNPKRFNRLIANLELLIIRDLYNLADLIELETIAVLTLVDNELAKTRKKRK